MKKATIRWWPHLKFLDGCLEPSEDQSNNRDLSLPFHQLNHLADLLSQGMRVGKCRSFGAWHKQRGEWMEVGCSCHVRIRQCTMMLAAGTWSGLSSAAWNCEFRVWDVCHIRGAEQIQRGTYLRAISSPSDSWHVILMRTHLRLMHYHAEWFRLW
jgi:hypothetical protein